MDSWPDFDALIEAVRSKDQRASARLFERFRGVLERKVDEHADARLQRRCGREDLVQEIWLKVDRSMMACEFPSPEAFAGWLSRVAYTVIIDAYRREAIRQPPTGIQMLEDGLSSQHAPIIQSLPADNDTPSHIVSQDELLRLVESAITSLSADDQVVLRLFLKGQTVRQIGDGIEMSSDAARKRLTRALDRCRDIMNRGD